MSVDGSASGAMMTPPAEMNAGTGEASSRPPASISVASEATNIETPMPLPQVSIGHETKEIKPDSAGRSDSKLIDQFSLTELEEIASKDNPDHSGDVEEKFSRLKYGSLGEKILAKERERGDLLTRSRQAVLHVALTEARISQLEQSLHKLDSVVRNLPPDFSLNKTKRRHCGRYQNIMKRCYSQDEFDLHLPRGRLKPVPADVRLEWPALEVLLLDRGVNGQHKPVGSNLVPQGDSTTRVPERLRIRYQPLLHHLTSITGEKTEHDVQTDGGMVFLRPFKYFEHHQAIKNSLPRLEERLRKAKEGRLRGSEEEDMMSNGKGLCSDFEFYYDDLISTLKLLIEFIDVDLKPVFELRNRIADGTLQEIEYADLWHLFKRGEYVVSGSNPTQAFQVVHYTGGRELLSPLWDVKDVPSAPVDGFVTDCTSLLFNGQEMVPRLTRFSISAFQGRQPVSSLEVYPLKLSPERERLERDILSHGSTYMKLVSSPFCHMMLKGRTLDEPPQDLEAQVIVDIVLATNAVPKWRVAAEVITESKLTVCDHRETTVSHVCGHTYRRVSEGCCGSDRVFKDQKMDLADLDTYCRTTGKLSPRKLESLALEDRMLLPDRVHGFVLRSRQWVTMRLSDLHPVEFLNDLDQLILPDNHKKTIKALVETHENSRLKAARTPTSIGAGLDLVRGKGAGLIILLHGEPGVGKTSTAECIADATARPLFPITCGDIGESPVEVEKNLHSNFQMAHKWGCVLLLDEADVFLAKRTQMDIRQNAITSVFLRSLEYYGGILFLTTNRVGGIDPAFKSRIHMALLYPALNLEATKQLYAVFIDRTRAEQQRAGVARFKIKRKEILKFAKNHYKRLNKLKDEGYTTWNGRQIRNAFQTAIALVEHDALHPTEGQPTPTLGQAQFEIVAEASRQFDEYLTHAIGIGETALAVHDKWRADGYAARPGPAKEKKKKKKGKSLVTKSEESEDDDSEDSSSDHDDDEEEDGDDGVGVSGTKQEGKATKGGAGKERAEASAAPAEKEDNDEMAQFEAFMKFQAMMKKSKMS